MDITNGKFVFSASEAYLIEDGQHHRAGQGRDPDRQRARGADPRARASARPRSSTRASAPAARTASPCRSASACRPSASTASPSAGPRSERPRSDRSALVSTCSRGAGSAAPPRADGLLVEERRSDRQVRLGEIETVKHAREQRSACACSPAGPRRRPDLRPLARVARAPSTRRVALARITAGRATPACPSRETGASARPRPRDGRRGARSAPRGQDRDRPRPRPPRSRPTRRITNSEGAEYWDRQGARRLRHTRGLRRATATVVRICRGADRDAENGEMQRDYWYRRAPARRLEDPEAVGREAARARCAGWARARSRPSRCRSSSIRRRPRAWSGRSRGSPAARASTAAPPSSGPRGTRCPRRW